MSVGFVFFDIGGTLGERNQAPGKLVTFAASAGLLAAVRDEMRLRLGVITTLDSLSNTQGRDILTQAGLAGFFDSAAFTSEHDVNGEGNPKSAIYQFAAHADGVPIDRCL